MSITDIQHRLTNCALCADQLGHGVRPVFQFSSTSKILIAGQAPGIKVHESGVPFDDASGDRLRQWMGIDRASFYDDKNIAIVPMAFCYPGKGKSGDLPPPRVCADTWRTSIMNELSNLQLTLVIGQYAQAWHLNTKSNVTETVKAWQAFPDSIFPLPHPSPRNNIWLKKNSWFEKELVPKLQVRVERALNQP